MCRQRAYDPDDITTRHAAVLVDDEEGNTYFFDTTPYVGYKYGAVEKCSDVEVYKEYDILDGEKKEVLYYLREFLYKCTNNLMTKKESIFYQKYMIKALKYPSLNGHNAQCIYHLSKFKKIKFVRSVLVAHARKLDPYSKIVAKNRQVNPSLLEKKKKLILGQVDKWKNELAKVRSKNKIDRKLELELAKNIYQELKLLDDSLETRVPVGGENNRISNLTPRIFKEEGLNVVMIKPSAYYLGVRGTIREEMLPHGINPKYEYFTNLAEPTKITGLKPMIFSHTVGDTYERSMTGTANILLVKEKAKVLYTKKKKLRAELGKNIQNKQVTWTDGEKILWHPFVTNLVHTTDNPSEACLHFLIAHPEQQLMTRFMYPNPKLEEDSTTEKEN